MSNEVWDHSWGSKKPKGKKRDEKGMFARVFDTPEDFWEAARSYFKWCVENPIRQDNILKLRNDNVETIEHEPTYRPRCFNGKGFCAYLQIDRETFANYKKGKFGDSEEQKAEFRAVGEHIDSIMYDHKYTGAAAGVYNWSVVAYELGIARETEAGEGKKEIPTKVVIGVEDCSVDGE